MKVVLAPDSFKESMTAPQAAAAMARGVKQVVPDADCRLVPMADGGEGTARALVAARGGDLKPIPARDALGRPRTCEIGLLPNDVAVIEIASAVGLEAIPPEERNPMVASSAGVADQVTAALDAGAQRLIVGLGGSATTDGGAGLLVGLGAHLRDSDGATLPAEPAGLDRVHSIDLSGLDPRLRAVDIELACDVSNPLLGPTGASAVFGPQKGANPAQVARLDHALTVLVEAVEAAIGRSIRDVPGAGAAGGLGAAFLALGAHRRPGVEVVMDATGLADIVAGSDLVLTGEGSIDSQTFAGKVPAGVAAQARRHAVPVVAFAGRVDASTEAQRDTGFLALVPILSEVMSLPEALAAGSDNLERAVARTMRLLAGSVTAD